MHFTTLLPILLAVPTALSALLPDASLRLDPEGLRLYPNAPKKICIQGCCNPIQHGSGGGGNLTTRSTPLISTAVITADLMRHWKPFVFCCACDSGTVSHDGNGGWKKGNGGNRPDVMCPEECAPGRCDCNTPCDERPHPPTSLVADLGDLM